MFIISYNCKGLNVLKKQYIAKLTKECDIILIQEHWLLNNRISDLKNDFKKHHIFSVCGMIETKHIVGRPYGGCAIFISKTITCTITYIDCGTNRICAVLCNFQKYIYWPTKETSHP